MFLKSKLSGTCNTSCALQHVQLVHKDSIFSIYDKNAKFELGYVTFLPGTVLHKVEHSDCQSL